MPMYKIYKEHLVSVIFEVEARSKIDARYKLMAAQMLEEEDPENEFKKQIVHVGETEYTPTHNIVIERIFKCRTNKKKVVNNASI